MGAEMTKNRFKWSAIVTALVAASLASGLALAADENESAAGNNCNNTIGQAMPLDFDGSGVAVMNGAIINGAGYNGSCDLPQHEYRDIDFYSFTANAGEDFDIAISNAWNGMYTWTSLGIYGPLDSSNHYPLLRHVDYMVNPDGSVNFEPFLDGGFHANAAGKYYVGVSSYPGFFYYSDGGLLMYSVFSFSPNRGTVGSYTLTVKGAKPPVQQISIEVKPGNNNATVLDASNVQHPLAVRGTAKGHLPVALLSSDTFDATKVDQSTLRFGSTGKEPGQLQRRSRHRRRQRRQARSDLPLRLEEGELRAERKRGDPYRQDRRRAGLRGPRLVEDRDRGAHTREAGVRPQQMSAIK